MNFITHVYSQICIKFHICICRVWISFRIAVIESHILYKCKSLSKSNILISVTTLDSTKSTQLIDCSMSQKSEVLVRFNVDFSKLYTKKEIPSSQLQPSIIKLRRLKN